MSNSRYVLCLICGFAAGALVAEATHELGLGFAAGFLIVTLVIVTDEICGAIKQQTKTLLNHQAKK